MADLDKIAFFNCETKKASACFNKAPACYK